MKRNKSDKDIVRGTGVTRKAVYFIKDQLSLILMTMNDFFLKREDFVNESRKVYPK